MFLDGDSIFSFHSTARTVSVSCQWFESSTGLSMSQVTLSEDVYCFFDSGIYYEQTGIPSILVYHVYGSMICVLFLSQPHRYARVCTVLLQCSWFRVRHWHRIQHPWPAKHATGISNGIECGGGIISTASGAEQTPRRVRGRRSSQLPPRASTVVCTRHSLRQHHSAA